MHTYNLIACSLCATHEFETMKYWRGKNCANRIERRRKESNKVWDAQYKTSHDYFGQQAAECASSLRSLTHEVFKEAAQFSVVATDAAEASGEKVLVIGVRYDLD